MKLGVFPIDLLNVSRESHHINVSIHLARTRLLDNSYQIVDFELTHFTACNLFRIRGLLLLYMGHTAMKVSLPAGTSVSPASSTITISSAESSALTLAHSLSSADSVTLRKEVSSHFL